MGYFSRKIEYMLGDISTTLDTRGGEGKFLDSARHMGKENEVFSRIIRTPFDVLLTFVSAKQKSLHYLSFRQTVAQQEGNLTSNQARPAHRGLERSHV